MVKFKIKITIIITYKVYLRHCDTNNDIINCNNQEKQNNAFNHIQTSFHSSYILFNVKSI